MKKITCLLLCLLLAGLTGCVRAEAAVHAKKQKAENLSTKRQNVFLTSHLLRRNFLKPQFLAFLAASNMLVQRDVAICCIHAITKH